jgi:hypothetical protein
VTTSTTTTTETTDPGTDEDMDGWSVENGDCDDNNVWVNPGWPEDITDDIDNDCDGRIDEVFTGVDVFEYDANDGSAWVQTIDVWGDLVNTQALDMGICPVWLEETPDGTGWFANDGLGLYKITHAGNVTQLVDLTKVKLPKGIGEYGLYGLGVHPDSTLYVSAVNALLGFQPTVSSNYDLVSEWTINLKDGKGHTVAPVDIAVDRFTGVVGMAGVWGGFATISDGEFEMQIADDIPYGGPYIFDFHSSDSGGFYGIGNEPKKGAYTLFGYDKTAQGWDIAASWVNDSYTPTAMAIEPESGDFYVTANGGWYRQVWRYYADGSGGAILHETEPDSMTKSYCALTVQWEED